MLNRLPSQTLSWAQNLTQELDTEPDSELGPDPDADIDIDPATDPNAEN